LGFPLGVLEYKKTANIQGCGIKKIFLAS